MWKKCSFSLFLVSHCTQRCHSVARRCWVARSHTHHTKSTYQSILNLYYHETRAASLFCFILKQKGRFSSALYTHINTQYVPTKIITLTQTQAISFSMYELVILWNLFCESASLIFPCNVDFFIRNTKFYPKYVYGATVKNHAYLSYENQIKRKNVHIIRLTNRQRNSTLISIKFVYRFGF